MATVPLYIYKVTKGKFKGKTVKSFESNTFIFGISSPFIACFDEEGNEYVIFCNELRYIGETELEVNNE